MIPEFAILGHPNEGKSSVLSTLAEDDSVRVSPMPGETTECRSFPVIIDGREVLRFTDTPGFQNPARVLVEMKRRAKSAENPLSEFRRFAATIPELHDDHELLGPLERGAGIIYVVDGSRPVRNVDKAEMEILRLTGKPRMAIINSKEESDEHLEAWKNEFRKNFNSNRVFNAHRATYAERILLLEALKSIDQDWQQPLSEVVAAFKKDWAARNAATVDILIGMLTDCLSLQLSENVGSEEEAEISRDKLFRTYSETLARKEKIAHERIRGLFKHNIFHYELPPHSVLHADLFDERTWQLLGMTRKQVVVAGGLGGAAIGAGLEMATLGHSLGIFTAVGTVVGALGALFGGESFSGKAQLMGIPLGGERVQVGPAKSIDLLFVLLNRSLLYYRHTINWAHGRRDYARAGQHLLAATASQAFTSRWSAGNIRICHDFFKIVGNRNSGEGEEETARFRELLENTLQEISEADR
jgi:GTP-binding protein EngB required for normal cell division